MTPFAVRVECDDVYEGTARILDIARRMGLRLERCVVDALQSGGFRLQMRVSDPLDEPARQALLFDRLRGVPALRHIALPERVAGEAWSAPAAPGANTSETSPQDYSAT